MNEKINHIIIPFKQALEICSKGSHRKVMWTCPKCKESDIRIFKSAIKIKLCKKCNNRIALSTRDFSGKNNPMYGKSLPGKTGSDNPMWKGGIPNCLDCSRKLGDRKATYCKNCWQKGKRNSNYKPELTEESRIKQRNIDKYRIWNRVIKQLADYTCQICKKRGGTLHSHHLNAWNSYIEYRYDINNGICLCKPCHVKFHEKFGKGDNTKKQFKQFTLEQRSS